MLTLLLPQLVTFLQAAGGTSNAANDPVALGLLAASIFFFIILPLAIIIGGSARQRAAAKRDAAREAAERKIKSNGQHDVSDK